MTKPLNFQSMMLSLQHFWAERGCLIWQPYYSQVGAGTMNPATALRVLGPEPWNVAYIEPTIRPDDGRYGDNPNRMQMHYQLQVILKPDPGNPQEVYLQSLAALGVDPRKHDLRFVEDNWESPALGAWGLGWEVWLNGQEITQFTYFQQAGGRLCDPVSVEITYGLDRIAIALQRVQGFQSIKWNEALTCGDVNLQAEQEHSQYYFDVADVGRLQNMYDLYEQEANICLEKNLVLPAHDYVLKCSHTFNVLDSRGAIGVTERQAYFGRMRDLSRRIADAYIEQRHRLEFPWLDETGAGQKMHLAAPGKYPAVDPKLRQAFLFEIGTEEIPAADLDNLLTQMAERFPILLNDLRLEHGEIKVMGTPRRLVVTVGDLASRQPDLEQVVKGPPASRAYDSLGVPTKAAEGFARSKGVELQDLQVREIDGGQYVAAVVRQQGRPTPEVLAEALPAYIASLRVDKPMRWNGTNVYFSRPIRWLMALYGSTPLTFEYGGVGSEPATRGLRFVEPETCPIKSQQDYFDFLNNQGVILDPQERQEVIRSQVTALAAEVQGEANLDPGLLAEVTNIVEAPAALRGSFDPSHLQLPKEVLISVMKKHQRYFSVQKEGKLLPYFITVSNRSRVDSENMELVIEGNEHVIRARFADADFFIRDDLEHSLEEFLPRLKTLIFQAKLGSMLDKSQRIQRVVEGLSKAMQLTKEEAEVARRAAELSKADLVTRMVVEMTSLQGTMGREYALRSGESQAVAQAIYEHYLPLFTGDAAPSTLPGLAVGVADRLDTLAGLFAAGLAPTGAKDPFGQRRAALGLVQALIDWDVDFDLDHILRTIVVSCLPIPVTGEVEQACLQFIVERLRNYLLEQGYRYDVVEAVVAAQGVNPAGASRAVKALSQWIGRPDWHTILPAYARCVRITRDLTDRFPVKPELLVEPAEKALYDEFLRAEAEHQHGNDVDEFLSVFCPMIPTVNTFFDEVLVMAEDQALRENRLGLLQRIAGLASDSADFSKLEGF
jgi:glycyl-tRNA synthetase